jgi:hypothetical protein
MFDTSAGEALGIDPIGDAPIGAAGYPLFLPLL